MRSGLVKKPITDKNGKRTYVWVRTDKGQVKKVSKKQVEETAAKQVKTKLEKQFAELYAKVKRREAGKGQEIKLTTDEVKTVLHNGMVGFVSAGVNPNDPEDVKLSDEDVAKRDEALKSDLVKSGFVFQKVHGKYGDEEDSYMVMVNDINEGELVSLGKKYNQASIIHSIENKNRMIFTVGENSGKRFEGSGFVELSGDENDFYSEVETKDGNKMRFSLNFNFDKMLKALMGLIGLK